MHELRGDVGHRGLRAGLGWGPHWGEGIEAGEGGGGPNPAAGGAVCRVVGVHVVVGSGLGAGGVVREGGAEGLGGLRAVVGVGIGGG